ncbi:hypothetical protein ACNQR7_30910 [Mycolicibacterium senegalense]|uniref:hypothetical protein n=1 Tax=Mycolicibacterium senegalense TaxID=1796 RepID=UPI003AAF26F6
MTDGSNDELWMDLGEYVGSMSAEEQAASLRQRFEIVDKAAGRRCDIAGLDAGWREDGYFRALRGPQLSVAGVAGDAEAVAELVRRAGVQLAGGPQYRARPSSEIRDAGWTSEAYYEAADTRAELVYQLGAGRPGGIEADLVGIARQLAVPRAELEEFARARAAALNEQAPQVESHRLFMPAFNGEDIGAHAVRGSSSRGWAVLTQWLDPQLLVSSQSRTWNDIDRNPRRDTVVNVAAWLAAAVGTAGGLDTWLDKMFGKEPILVRLIPGPAGPIYEVVTGTHRSHAARIWGLPWVLARVQIDNLPTPIGPSPAGDLSGLWRGLVARGLLQAEVVGDIWYIGSVVAEWMLTAPVLATQMNAAYERAYPGALQAVTGMATEELTEPVRWEQALAGGASRGDRW